MRFLVEKNQISGPIKPETNEGWVSFERARDSGVRKEAFDLMPPGMDIANQNFSEQNPMPEGLAGSTDVSSAPTQPKALKDGFARLDMKGTDDLYTGEHVDLFYGDVGGFCERNNYLDRN